MTQNSLKEFLAAIPDAELRILITDILAWHATGEPPSQRLLDMAGHFAAAAQMGQWGSLLEAEKSLCGEAATRYLASPAPAENDPIETCAKIIDAKVERVIAANTHRGKLSSAGSYAVTMLEDCAINIRALKDGAA